MLPVTTVRTFISHDEPSKRYGPRHIEAYRFGMTYSPNVERLSVDAKIIWQMLAHVGVQDSFCERLFHIN